MKCQCGYENSAGALFCAKCGLALVPVKQPGRKRSAFFLVTAVVVVLGILSFLLLYPSPSERTMEAIDAIGTVTMDSEEAILLAEEKLEALDPKQRDKVTNQDVLRDARKEYNRQKQLIDDAIQAVNAIGEVTLDSGDVISNARLLFEKARDLDTRGLLDSARETLEAAETEYNRQINDQENILNLGLAEIDGAVSLILAGNADEAHANIQYYMSKLTDLDKLEAFETAVVDALTAEANNQHSGGNDWMALRVLGETESYTAHCDKDSLEASEALANKITVFLEKKRPKNGEILTRTSGSGRCNLKITAGGYDTCVKIERVEDLSKYGLYYIRANETSTVYLSDGTYRIKYTVGPTWYNQDIMFGPDATYVLLKDTISPDTYTSGGYIHWSTYTWTVNVGYGSDWGYQNMDPSDF